MTVSLLIFGSSHFMAILYINTGITIIGIIYSTLDEYVGDKYKLWFFGLLYGIAIGIAIWILSLLWNFIDVQE